MESKSHLKARREIVYIRYPAKETAEKHDRILAAAAQLFRERGFAGVSVGEIMKAAGLTHGPFYNHFESKEHLLTECVDRTSLRTLALLEAFKPTAAGFEAYRDWYLGPGHRDDPGHGCLIASLGAEASRDGALKPSMTAHITKSIAKLADRFPWSSKRKARSESIRAFASMIGAIVMARAVDDEALSDEILSEVRRSLR